MRILLIFIVLFQNANAVLFDAYHGTPISLEEYKDHVAKNNTFWCVKDVKLPCNPYEGRRLDGSCNNLQYPVIGTMHTPTIRVLPADYANEVSEPRKAASGADLPLARPLRTELLAEGRVPSMQFTQMLTHFWTFIVSDFLSLQDTVNYVIWKPYCCQAKGKTDRACVPNKILDNDPVHRFSSSRCINMTRPESFQSHGCIPQNTVFERVLSATPLLDLSNLYGTSEDVLLQKFRTGKNGQLKYEIEDGKIWPPSYKTPSVCYLNQPPSETRCHKTPEDSANSLLAINIFVIWFWRNHNLIAAKLAEINPCWSDQKCFDTARDINIATVAQMFYYEAMPALLGRQNLIDNGVISPDLGFRDIYDPDTAPCITLEYPYVLRWMHTMQEGSLKMYDAKGCYLKQVPIVNMTMRTGYLANDNNLAHITQGCFRQKCANADHVVDPDIAEVGLGPLQETLDVTTNDLAKGRYFGFQPYIKYRQICFGHKVSCWNDLLQCMSPERIEMLKTNYPNINDVDLMSGIWSEKPMRGGSTPSIMYCVVVDQTIRNIVSDRHWFERPNRPNAFTLPQLLEIRKRTIASFVCDVGDSVTEIQPSAFLNIGRNNKLTECCKVSQFDFSKWKDPRCGTRC